MNEKLAIEVARKITIDTVNRTFGYEYNELYQAILKGIALYVKKLPKYDSEKSEKLFCEWTLTDKDVADYPVYDTECDHESIMSFRDTCQHCGKKIQINLKETK